MNVPALHLTIGVKVPRAADLLSWLAGRAHTIAARDLPTMANAAERAQFSDQLRAEATAGLEQDLVEQYSLESGSNRKVRPSFSLPFSATAEGLPPSAEFSIRLNPPLPRMVRDASGDSMNVWQCGSRTCRFPRAMRPILAQLADGQSMPFSRLGAAVGGELDEAAVRFLVGMLVSQNLVAIRQA